MFFMHVVYVGSSKLTWRLRHCSPCGVFQPVARRSSACGNLVYMKNCNCFKLPIFTGWVLWPCAFEQFREPNILKIIRQGCGEPTKTSRDPNVHTVVRANHLFERFLKVLNSTFCFIILDGADVNGNSLLLG